MFHVLGCIFEQHDLRFLALAVVLCVASCGAAMAMVARARLIGNGTQLPWTICAGFVAGFGI
jgi:NO-binding membrane sensor protein with MHYT domain